ncbi:probable inactive receptor kinase At5g67200 [Rutidosis leptorrhynchoides]|uniref:probable inactive receptor kinase At5g67200 n=1 Tax=Rutidosis leptorrhynchoides TaxID=125765 RepID=UPI003A990335
MKPTFIHTTIILLFSFYTLTLSSSNNAIEPLLSFKSKADLSNKLVTYSVTNNSTVCKWQGVKCLNNDVVVQLVLENLNLSGVFASNTLTRLDQLRVLSLRNNSLTGPIPDLSMLVNIKALFLDSNYFSGVIPLSISSLHRLRTLDLSNNELSGNIPVELIKLDRLNYIRLDSNRFNGSIPPLNQSGLEIFNVSVNHLSGLVPVTATLARFGPNMFSVNGELCGEIVHKQCEIVGMNSTKNKSSTSDLQEMEGFEDLKSRKREKFGLVVGFSGGLVLVISSVLCVIMSIKISKKKKKRKKIIATRELMEMAEAADAAAEVMRMEEKNELERKVRMLQQGVAIKKSGNLVFCTADSHVYTIEQLMRASAELLGSGMMGTTYKALVDNRVIVCVKRLDSSRLVGTTNEEFEMLMEVVGKVRHTNVVTLRAYFQTKDEKLLVYDYQPNGSLFSLIHVSQSTMARPLHWTSCLKIAEDVAQGLLHLHQTCNLVHGNLKSSNVLLDSDFEARISDYHLSHLFHHESNAYRAPEIEPNQEPTAKSDVYSFGVVLLELLTGKAASSHPKVSPDEVVKWVKSSRDNGGAGGGVVEEKRLEMMTGVAIACGVRSPEMRPTMWQVIEMLQKIKEAAVMEDCGLDP